MRQCKNCWWNQGYVVTLLTSMEGGLMECGNDLQNMIAVNPSFKCDHHMTQDEFDELNPIPEQPEPDTDFSFLNE